ncbi:hypothetical protein HBI73_059220 [Parastagonospora nodorum]|nr:hypothetical protein HBH51_062430 [Parastagonospora nodorum]KAH3999065.1 hypothetical protein HBI10_119070 [Parastagonospora nodorum]KAH4025156.1 hypothetical protein HBI13_078120 [Parastagonospora nodorum]KAH4122778.1 hypothetical protein HBH47_081630 [Parastagonospora nodorum]KAH4603400.1 hypothetical protein HBH82_146540 [Parastagonospora nodorum]
MAQASFFYEVAFAFQHFDDTARAFGVNKYSYHTLAILLDLTLFERDLQLYYEGLVLANRYGDAFDRNLEMNRIEREERPAPNLAAGDATGNLTHQTRLLSLFQRDNSNAEAVGMQRPGGDMHSIKPSGSLAGAMNLARLSQQIPTADQRKNPATAFTTASSHECGRVPQLESIAEYPCVVTSEPNQRSKKKAYQRKQKEAEAPMTPIAMPVPRSGKLGNVVAAWEQSSDATAAKSIADIQAHAKVFQDDSSHWNELSHGLSNPHADQADTPSKLLSPPEKAPYITTRSLTADVMMHPMTARGDESHWAKLIHRLLDPNEVQQEVLSELYFFPGTVPTSDYEVAAREQATDALLEQVNALRKLVDESPYVNFKKPDEMSLFDQGMTGIALFRQIMLAKASKSRQWEEYARKKFAARIQNGEPSRPSLIEGSQDHSAMAPPRPRIASARSNSEDIWESDAMSTTKSDKNGLTATTPREPVSRIKRRG